MAKVITTELQHSGASGANITLDGSKNVTCENNLQVDGNLTVTGTSPQRTQPFRNLIINGAMNVAQRGASSTSGGYASVDRFKVVDNNTNVTITQSQHALTSSDTGPWAKGFRKSWKQELSAAGNSLDGTTYLYLVHLIEGQDIAGSGWDYTSASSKITLSFWFKASTNQTFYGRVMSNDGTTQNYPFSFTATGNDTWTKITKTIPGSSNNQIDNDNGAGFKLEIALYAGADRTDSGVSLNTWAAYASGTRIPDMANTWITAGTSSFELTGVQLEVGDTATDFEHKSYTDELIRCQRYCWMVENDTTVESSAFGIGYCKSTTTARWFPQFPVEMRAAPTLTPTGVFRVHDGTAVNTITVGSSGSVTAANNRARHSTNVVFSEGTYSQGSAFVLGRGAQIYGNGTDAAKLVFSAEL